jgi:NIMA (never in mitosis gene a)-related kinase
MITLQPPFTATSMAGLSQKVTRGTYTPIPNHFSKDLANIVKMCLQVKPSNRPLCDKILATPGLLNHMTGTLENLDLQAPEEEVDNNLLATIRCPRNLG